MSVGVQAGSRTSTLKKQRGCSIRTFRFELREDEEGLKSFQH